jgi:hypothetical protein
MKRQTRGNDFDRWIVNVALTIFLLISLSTVSCEKGKTLCQEAEGFIRALQHLMSVVKSPNQQQQTAAPRSEDNKESEEQTEEEVRPKAGH